MKTRLCSICKQVKNLDLFPIKFRTTKCIECYKLVDRNKKTEFREKNREAYNESMRVWRNKFPERAREYTKNTNIKRRIEVLKAYGGTCMCCNESRLEFLAIDHINNDGAEMRRQFGGGQQYLIYLQKNNYPAGHQILCHNCNSSKGFYGYCPHKEDKKNYFVVTKQKRPEIVCLDCGCKIIKYKLARTKRCEVCQRISYLSAKKKNRIDNKLNVTKYGSPQSKLL